MSSHPHAPRLISAEDCVEATLSRVGKRIVLGMPVAIGKPNTLINAFVARALAEPDIQLTVITALSLRRPGGSGELERRFYEPFNQRLFGNYPELEHVRLLARGKLPKNIEIIEFYVEPGAWLYNDHLQQHHLSSNYTHVGRDALRRGLNVIAQLVAPAPADEAPASVFSLGANADLTADLLPQIASRRGSANPLLLIGQVHRQLPFMYGDALLTADAFDLLVQDPDTELFCPPNMPISPVDHAIALNVSTLIRDGGTLQVGIGELGDGICHALQLRHQEPAMYREILESIGLLATHRRLIETEGGTAPFERGLYGCTEMLADGMLDLYRSGILKRRVYPSARLQRLIDQGHIDAEVSQRTLDALANDGMSRMSFADFHVFREVGLFRDDVEYEHGVLVTAAGEEIRATFSDPEQRALIARTCLGDTLRNGVLVDAGFFFGPRAFYAGLRNLPGEQRRLFAMRGISFVNELHGHEWELKVAQRRHARFINTTMMITGLGAAVSDALADGRVVSGVGGQYNFVAMAHALPEARSILCLRATRTSKGVTTSNIVWNYANTTIPRHLRDIVVTEYGIADLRGRTDSEVIQALAGIMDARFQDEFIRTAVAAGKLPRDWQPPASSKENTPDGLKRRFAPWRKRGLFAPLPYGTDFTAEELQLAKALQSMQSASQTFGGKLRLLGKALLRGNAIPQVRAHLKRMDMDSVDSLSLRLQKRMLTATLREQLAGGAEQD